MKNFNKYFLIAFTAIGFTACSSDDDGAIPEIVNEEEVITTVSLTLVSSSDNTTIELTSRDIDGDGPNEPVVTVSGTLDVNTIYDASISFLNETVSPAEDITEEVEDESDEHQVFYIPNQGVELLVEYQNFDENSNPLGTMVTLTTGSEAVAGSLTVTLRHELLKPNDGTLDGAGGDTDVQVTFPIEIVE